LLDGTEIRTSCSGYAVLERVEEGKRIYGLRGIQSSGDEMIEQVMKQADELVKEHFKEV